MRSKTEILPLTTFRFFAALTVFLLHLATWPTFPASGSGLPAWVAKGGIGVTFFFILSGFILTLNYHSKLATGNAREIEKFLIARIARVYPMHWLTFALMLPLVYTDKVTDWVGEGFAILLNLSLLQSFVPLIGVFHSFNSPSWSLSDEMFFYALLPFILAIIVSKGQLSWRRFLGLALVCGVGGAIVIGYQRDDAASYWMLSVAPFIQIINFIFGVLLCFVYLHLQQIQLNKLLGTILEVSALGGLALALYWSPLVPSVFQLNLYYTPFFCLMVLIFAFQAGLVSKLLATRWMVWLGEISFSFYMLHRFVILTLDRNGWFMQQPVYGIIGAFGITLVLSYVCYRFFETPLRDLVRKTQTLTLPQAKSKRIELMSIPDSSRQVQDSRATQPEHQLIFIVGVVLIMVLAGVLGLPSLAIGFIGEIWNSFEAAQRLSFWQYLAFAFDPRVQVSNYHPLSRIFFWGEHAIFGNNLMGYRIARLAFQMVDMALLYWLLSLLLNQRKLAFALTMMGAGSLFFLMPMLNLADSHIEMTMFYLLCIGFWIQFLRTQRRRFSILAMVCFVLALLTKETSATLLLVMLFIDRWVVRGDIQPGTLFHRYMSLIFLLGGALVLSLQIPSPGLSSVWGFVCLPLAIFLLICFELKFDRMVRILLFITTLFVIIQISPMFSGLFSDIGLLVGTLAWLMLGLGIGYAMHFSRRTRLALILGLCVMMVGLAASFSWIVDTSADLSETIRQRRQPFRDISARHVKFAPDTALYFINPPYFRDLRGLFLWRYGPDLVVASSAHDYDVNDLLEPTLQRLGASTISSSHTFQPVSLRNHPVTLLYHFDSTNKPMEIVVDRPGSDHSQAVPPLPAKFGSWIQLHDYEISASEIRQQETMVLILYWKTEHKLDLDYTVFVHLVDQNGNRVAGVDSQPMQGTAPTTSWQPGQVVVDVIQLPILPELPVDQAYHLEIGLYDLATFARLELIDAQGHPFDDKIIINAIQVVEK